ncbi:hypothetical protein [uncultured Roseobacter sp.]|uniref:hypothetical protein n=1 Tax=uncultured Roseobacter sp. TaxID=114847 RepID=UPI0026138EC3|nr:hypothetical protein [uncultured Roseobacter sp.]
MKRFALFLVLALPQDAFADVDADTFEFEPKAFIICVSSHFQVTLRMERPGGENIGMLILQQYLTKSEEWTNHANPFIEFEYDITDDRFEFEVTYNPKNSNAPSFTHFNFPLTGCTFLNKT